jgi:hypothetical protein
VDMQSSPDLAHPVKITHLKPKPAPRAAIEPELGLESRL